MKRGYGEMIRRSRGGKQISAPADSSVSCDASERVHAPVRDGVTRVATDAWEPKSESTTATGNAAAPAVEWMGMPAGGGLLLLLSRRWAMGGSFLRGRSISSSQVLSPSSRVRKRTSVPLPTFRASVK